MATQPVSIKFAGGIDTKSDPKLVQPTKLLTLQNALFTKAGQLSKRNGYDSMTTALVGGGTWSSPTMVTSYKNELLLAGTTAYGRRLLSYSPSANAWSDKGKLESIEVSKQVITTEGNSTTNSSSQIIGNFQYIATDSANSYSSTGALTSSFVSVLDLNTNTYLGNWIGVTNSVGFSKVTTLGTSSPVAAIFYVKSTSGANNLVCRLINNSSGSIILGSENVIGTCNTNATSPPSGAAYACCYDVITTSFGAYVIVSAGPNVKVYKVNTTGAVTGSSLTIAASNAVPLVTGQIDASENIWIYYTYSSSATLTTATYSLYVAVYASNLSTVLMSPAAIATGQPAFSQVTAYQASSTIQYVYFSSHNYPPTYSSTIYNGVLQTVVKVASVDISIPTVIPPAVLLENVDIYGKVFTYNNSYYLPVVAISTSSPTAFLIDLTNLGGSYPVIGYAAPVAKFLVGEAEGLYIPGYILNDSAFPPITTWPTLLSFRVIGFINTFQLTPQGKLNFVSNYIATQNIATLALGTTVGTTYAPVEVPSSTINGVAIVTIDFNSQNSFQAVTQQDTLVINGGIVSMYDGAYVSELGFNVTPDNIGFSPSTGGSGYVGNIGTGTFIYYVTYSWIDANGQFYESAPSVGFQVKFTASPSSNQVGIYVPNPWISAKQAIKVNIYRSDSNLGGNIAYQIYSTTINPSAGTLYTFYQDLTPSGTTSLNTLYTQNGAILDNTSPPPAMIMWSNQNRLWVVDSENPKTTIEYSKTAASGYGISFSTGLLEYRIDSKYGNITGASPMDEKTVLFKESGLGYFYGDGANDAGTGATLTPFQFVPSDVGCSYSKSVLLYPGGVMFMSSKGIYQVTRGMQVQYIGAEVEAYNSQNITAATIVSNKNQIRFLTSTGTSLLYDYYFGQWSTFTNHQGLSSTLWNGSNSVYVYVYKNGSTYALYKENSSSFLDNTTSISMFIQTDWIKASTVQNFQRVRLFELLGNYSIAATDPNYGAQISFAYDFTSSFTPTNPFYFSKFTDSTGVFQQRIFTPRQKCNAIQVQIQELTTGVSGEFFDVSDLDMEIMLKQGLNKLAASVSTG